MDPPISKPDILIRAMEPADLPDITEAWNQPRAYAGTLQLPFTSLDTRQQRHAAHAGSIRLVAVIDGKAIGMIFLGREENRRSHVGSIGMAVHDAYAGRGVGTALMAAVIDMADNWLQIKRLELSVYADNARAIALYERFGFEREGFRKGHYYRAGEDVDAILMALTVAAPAGESPY